jgi:hypothetical protein
MRFVLLVRLRRTEKRALLSNSPRAFGRMAIASVVLALSLSSDARGEEVSMGLFSVKLPVIAILDENLFVGEAIGYLDRTGSIDLQSALEPKVKCVGTFRYTGLATGLADMKCDDGVRASLSFKGLGAFSGYGVGSTPKGPASFTFGLTPKEAVPHLILPKGKRLVEGSEGLRLEAVHA